MISLVVNCVRLLKCKKGDIAWTTILIAIVAGATVIALAYWYWKLTSDTSTIGTSYLE